MKLNWSRSVWLGILTATLAAGTALADIKTTARTVFEKNKEAVIKVSAVIKIEAPGRGNQGQDVEICGTVISPDGLVVVSAAALNPIGALLDAAGEERVSTKPKVELTQVKYVLMDGTEIPARLVYKDKDLDLAFLVPDLKEGEKAPKFSSLEVKEGAKARELDEVILVARLSKAMSHVPSVALGNVTAVVSKPRTIYDFAMNGTPFTGTPVFAGTGELLGFAMKHHEDGSVSAAALQAMAQGGGEIIILPAGEVAGLVEQARKAAAKKETKPAAEKISSKEEKESESK